MKCVTFLKKFIIAKTIMIVSLFMGHSLGHICLFHFKNAITWLTCCVSHWDSLKWSICVVRDHCFMSAEINHLWACSIFSIVGTFLAIFLGNPDFSDPKHWTIGCRDNKWWLLPVCSTLFPHKVGVDTVMLSGNSIIWCHPFEKVCWPDLPLVLQWCFSVPKGTLDGRWTSNLWQFHEQAPEGQAQCPMLPNSYWGQTKLSPPLSSILAQVWVPSLHVGQSDCCLTWSHL